MTQMTRNQMSRNQMSRSSYQNGYPVQTSRSYGNSCGCQQQSKYETMNQAQLFNHINEVSFAVEDIILFLDTHPYDCEALAYCNEMVAMRTEALDVYARRFGPLTIDTTDECSSDRWEWIMQPFPWETKTKGGCR